MNRGIIVTRINGKVYDGVFSSKGDEWKKRRRVLTPAFSANKMKMVRLCGESQLRVSHVCIIGTMLWCACVVCVCVLIMGECTISIS